MANILTKEQSAQIRAWASKQNEIDNTFGLSSGWMCEGADDNQIIFFNNEMFNKVEGEKGVSFYADYFGNITANWDEVEISDELKEIVRLEGLKCQVAYFGRILSGPEELE